MNGVEIWVWRNGKKYMCFACERLLSDHNECQAHMQSCLGSRRLRALVPFLQAVGA